MRRYAIMAIRIALSAAAALCLSGCQQGSAKLNGAQAFAQACGGCHQAEKLPGPKRDLSDPRQRAELDVFLARHHAPDPASRKVILDHIAGQKK